MKITSPAFEQYQEIPKRYTCDGENISPPLAFQEIPKGVHSFVLIVEDPDAPKGTFDHWIIWNISSDASGLPEKSSVPRQGVNSYGVQEYRGPCPPPGPSHRYFFKLYAIDTILDIPQGSTKQELLKAIQGHIISQAELVGKYGR